MVKREYEIGDRHNNWEILGSAPRESKRRQRKVKVECDCGYIGERLLSQIINSKGTTCRNCITNHKHNKSRRKLKKTEPKYGRLTVIGQRIGPDIEPNIEVRCKCGKEKFVRLTSLKNGNTTTCGDCHRKTLRAKWGTNPKKSLWTDGLGRVIQPKSTSNEMRMKMSKDNNSGCNQDGMCARYTYCGDRGFDGDCLGFKK